MRLMDNLYVNIQPVNIGRVLAGRRQNEKHTPFLLS